MIAKRIRINGVLTEEVIAGERISQHIGTDNWPLWAKAFKQLRAPSDKGIGDVVARMIGDENTKTFEVWFESTFKRKCGCKGRHARWNQLYPLWNDLL